MKLKLSLELTKILQFCPWTYLFSMKSCKKLFSNKTFLPKIFSDLTKINRLLKLTKTRKSWILKVGCMLWNGVNFELLNYCCLKKYEYFSIVIKNLIFHFKSWNFSPWKRTKWVSQWWIYNNNTSGSLGSPILYV